MMDALRLFWVIPENFPEYSSLIVASSKDEAKELIISSSQVADILPDKVRYKVIDLTDRMAEVGYIISVDRMSEGVFH